jgi:hypothetical protein
MIVLEGGGPCGSSSGVSADATWARARAWVVEQAVPFLPYYDRTLPAAVAVTRARLASALADRTS